MADRDGSGDVSVNLCVQRFDRLIAELAHRHGTASVAAALTEIVGCSWCARDVVSHGKSIRTLIARIGVDKDTTSS